MFHTHPQKKTAETGWQTKAYYNHSLLELQSLCTLHVAKQLCDISFLHFLFCQHTSGNLSLKTYSCPIQYIQVALI